MTIIYHILSGRYFTVMNSFNTINNLQSGLTFNVINIQIHINFHPNISCSLVVLHSDGQTYTLNQQVIFEIIFLSQSATK